MTPDRYPAGLRQMAAGIVADLYPGYFALVMATGIVSIALHQQNFEALARVMLVFNVAAWVAAWLLTLVRLLRYPARVWADVLDPQRSAGFLTIVAGTSVLGRQLVLMTDDLALPFVLWVVSAICWIALLYGFIATLMLRDDQPIVERSLHGGWLLAIVATQAVSLLGMRVVERAGGGRDLLVLAMLGLFLLGCLLYVYIGGALFFRLLFLRPVAAALTPLYWIAMGAAAITVVAGATLVETAPDWRILPPILSFLTGLTLLFWAVGTWWIPLLIVLGVWRHLIRRHPVIYEPQYWGMVFPLGMYSVATHEVSKVLDLPSLNQLSQAFAYLALLAWAGVLIGMGRRIASRTSAAMSQRERATTSTEP